LLKNTPFKKNVNSPNTTLPHYCELSVDNLSTGRAVSGWQFSLTTTTTALTCLNVWHGPISEYLPGP